MACDVIGLTGPAGSGKSTVAAYLNERYGYTRLRFAGPLKAMMRCIGLDERHIEGELKERPIPLLCGKTPRYAMQTIGTDWGRAMIGEDLWVNIAEDSARRVLDEQGAKVVFEDVRYDNEVHTIEDRLGGHVLRLTGRGTPVSDHISERGITRPLVTFLNDGSLSTLYRNIDIFLQTRQVDNMATL